MRIQREDKPYATAKINLLKFKEDMQAHFDLEKAVLDNMKIIQIRDEQVSQKILKLIYMGIDWGNFLMLYNNLKAEEKRECTITIHKCIITDLMTYEPKEIEVICNTEKGRTKYNFESKKIDRIDFLILNTFNTHLSKALTYMLYQNLVSYDEKDWEQIIFVDESKELKRHGRIGNNL